MRKNEEKFQREFLLKIYLSVIESLSYPDPIANIKQLKSRGTYKDCLSYCILEFHKNE